MDGLVLEDVLDVYGQPTSESQKVGEVHSGEKIHLGMMMVKGGVVWRKTVLKEGLLHGWVATGTKDDMERWVAWRKND